MITIATPLYNSEMYIIRCLQSVITQSYKNIEMLIINDGCTDKSIECIQAFKTSHPQANIRIIHQEKNQGVAMARNKAIEEANGEYLLFLDSDDSLPTDSISTLIQAMETQHANFVMGSYCSYKDSNNENKNNSINKPAVITCNDAFYKYVYTETHNSLITYFVWNILFDLRFLRSIGAHFRPLRKSEDQLFFLDIMPNIESCVVLPDITYHYIQRNDSLSGYGKQSSISTTEIEEQVNVMRAKKEIINGWNKNPYYSDILFSYIRESIWMLLSIAKNRAMIQPSFPHKEVHFLCQSPIPVCKIFSLKRRKLFLLGYALWGKTPMFIQETILNIISKRSQ